MPDRVYPSAREAMPSSATAAGPRRRPIPDGAPSVAAGSGARSHARTALPKPQEFLSVVETVTNRARRPPQPSMAVSATAGPIHLPFIPSAASYTTTTPHLPGHSLRSASTSRVHGGHVLRNYLSHSFIDSGAPRLLSEGEG